MNINAKMDLEDRVRELEYKLEEAMDTIAAIRNGQVDALVVNQADGPSLYTLRSADHAYRIFIEKMAEGAVSMNSSGLIVYSNSKFAELLEQPLTRVIGSYFSDHVEDSSKEKFNELFSNSWEQNLEAEICLVSTDRGVPVKLSISAFKIDGETSLNVIVTDLTVQKASEKDLKENNELLEKLNEALSISNHDLQQFASVASHDLQEPIRKIQVYSKLLKDTSYRQLHPDAQQHLEKIILSSQRMRTLIVDILTYSRLSAENMNFQLTDLTMLFNEIIEDFDLRITERQALVELGDLPTAEVNRGQMRQVFTNLISNALKFVKPGIQPKISIQSVPLDAKHLSLSLANPEAYCRLVIKDNGIGFDDRFAASIFSLFEKLNPKSSFEGSGIGLAIAKKIIDKHHGIIIARSKEGLGSEFNVILPLTHDTNHGS